MTLTEFLLARIAEDESVATKAAGDGPPTPMGYRPDKPGSTWVEMPYHQTREVESCCFGDMGTVEAHPVRVLAECSARRRIMEEHRLDQYGDRIACSPCGFWPSADGGCPTLRLLALPYAGHADYDEDWRP